MNVFEGARRLTILAGAIGSIVIAIAAWADRPTPTLSYSIKAPGKPPVREAQGTICGEDEASEYLWAFERPDLVANVRLCFKAVRDGERSGVPYKVDGDMWLINERYSSDVTTYTKAVADRFVIPEVGLKWVEEQRLPRFLKGVALAVASIVGLWLGLWIFAKTTGWIVRGFAGIPNGKDHRRPTNPGP